MPTEPTKYSVWIGLQKFAKVLIMAGIGYLAATLIPYMNTLPQTPVVVALIAVFTFILNWYKNK